MSETTRNLFLPATIAGHQLQNRIVMAPMTSKRAEGYTDYPNLEVT